MIISYDDYIERDSGALEHYGVPGMKWGVRNERKSTGEKQKRQLTNKQKNILKGAAAVGVVLAAYGAYKLTDSGEANRLLMKGKAAITGSVAGFKQNPELSKPMDVDEIMTKVVAHVNPGAGESFGTSRNCRRATLAYELRRRGFDVAATKTIGGEGQAEGGLQNALNPGGKQVSTKLKSATRYMVEGVAGKTLGKADPTPGITDATGLGSTHKVNPLNIFPILSRQPEGARGELAVGFAGGAHSMAWEKVKGKLVVFDPQWNEKHIAQDDTFFDTFGGVLNITEAGYTRLDNVPLNTDFLMRWAKNAA